MKRVCALIVLAAGCGGEVPADVPELGALSQPSVVLGRDGSAAGLVAGRMLWTFNDTLMTVYGVDGFSYRSATAGWAAGGSTSLQLDEHLDANGAPYQLVPYTSDEIAYNRAHGPDQRYAMWPDAVIPDSPDTALIFSGYIQLLPGYLNWNRLGTVVARIQSGQTVAVRQPAPLFAPPEPSFDAGGIVADGYLYLYLYSFDPSPCPVARAPLSQATEHDAWQVWNGTGWAADLTTGAPVLDNVPGELSVSWNAYLGSYLAVHSVPLSNQVVPDCRGAAGTVERAAVPVHRAARIGQHQLRGQGAPRAGPRRRAHPGRRLRRCLGGIRQPHPPGPAETALTRTHLSGTSPRTLRRRRPRRAGSCRPRCPPGTGHRRRAGLRPSTGGSARWCGSPGRAESRCHYYSYGVTKISR